MRAQTSDVSISHHAMLRDVHVDVLPYLFFVESALLSRRSLSLEVKCVEARISFECNSEVTPMTHFSSPEITLPFEQHQETLENNGFLAFRPEMAAAILLFIVDG